MAKEWTDDEIKAEINAAVRIAREDGILSHMRNLHDKLDKILAGPSTDPDGTTEGQPPPRQEPQPSNDLKTKKKKSLWWGELDDETEEKK